MQEAERAARLEKARGEIAILALMGMLLVPVVLALFLADTRMDARAMALMIVGTGFILPAAVVKLVGPRMPRGSILAAAVLPAVAAHVATFQIWITAIAFVCGATGSILYHRIRENRAYQPRLRGK